MHLDDVAALLLFEAVARQAHRDASGMDSATNDERMDALTFLAQWQGCDTASVQVAAVRASHAVSVTGRKRGRKPAQHGARHS